MDKKTLSMNIENGERILGDYQTSFVRFKHRIDNLKKAYEASKAHAPNIRYEELKTMIKETVNAGVWISSVTFLPDSSKIYDFFMVLDYESDSQNQC